MAQSPIELEAAGSAAALLKAYDAATDRWTFSRDTDFWRAVGHAHAIGFRGKDQRVAIIDTECDVGIPRLCRQVGKVKRLAKGSNGPKSHGSAVALLISEVAPDCVLDIYGVVADDGSIDEGAIVEAIEEAAQSDASVINLSLGKRQEWVPRGDPSSSFGGDWRKRKREQIAEPDPCHLCRAASEAAERGKLVFAAVGNERFDLYCPARAEQVIAVGFQQYKTMKPAPDKEITSLAPVSGQAIHADLMLLTLPDALGSSFACPLYAGVAALGLTQAELQQFISSYSERVYPMMFHAQIDTGVGLATAPAGLVESVETGYWRSLSLLSHAHCETQYRRFPDLPRSDPKICPFCGIFAHLQYINFGYWLFE